MKCPDNGKCHHECELRCWRVQSCLPLTISGWEDWPESIKRQHIPTDWRAEVFAPGDDGPFWVSVDGPSGFRDASEALSLVSSFYGHFDQDIEIRRVIGRVEDLGPAEGWHFHKDPAGELEFWEISE